MFRKAFTAILARSAVFAVLAISALAQAQSSWGQQTGLTNPGFEAPRVEEGTYVLVETMPGWKTTDKEFEIWGSGFLEVPAHEGNQFVELNAWIDGTLYQDSTGIQQGSVLEFTFAHRGRNGDDAMKLTITDLGADNALDGGDDTVLFTKEYTTGKDAWTVYDSTKEKQIKALGNTVRFAYGAVSATGGNLGQGNLLDAANFGIGVVSAPPMAMNETEAALPTRKLINTSFEEPRGKESGFAMAPAMPGWKTTDEVFEIWSTGFGGFEAHDGTQFVELNARLDGTLYQDLTGIGQGAELDFSFAHRGRNGNDTMMLTITDLGIDDTFGSDDDRVLFVKEYTTGKEAWEVYTNTSEVPIVTLGNTIRFAYTAIHGTGGRGPDKTEGNFLDSVNFGVDVGRPATRSFTLEEAKQMLIGEWKADLSKTETRYGKLDFMVRPMVCEGFLLKFSADSAFQLVTGNSVMSTSYEVKGPDDDNYFQVVTLQDGQEVTEDVRIVDIHHIILKSRSGATPLMFFRHFEPEDNIGRVHKAPVEMVTAGDSETITGDDIEHIVTRDAEDQHGAVWTQDKFSFNETFKISADVYLGTKDDGADGMALVFQVKGNDTVSTGSGIGYQGVTPSIAIEFDTYQNRDELNDPAQDHVAVRTNGSPIHTASDYVEVGNLEDGKYHPMTFEWNAAKQTFNLTLDGKQLFKDASIPENGLADQQVYFGFTAATGLYSNLHKVRRISLSK